MILINWLETCEEHKKISKIINCLLLLIIIFYFKIFRLSNELLLHSILLFIIMK